MSPTLLGRLVSGDESDAPQITTAEDWHVGFAPGPRDDPAAGPRRKPDYCLNIGITWAGLVALEIEERPPIEITGLSSFITTKAAAYVFLPSITAIKFVANLGEGL